MNGFKIDTSEIKRFELDLLKFTSRALPIATRTMLNNAAFELLKRSRKKIQTSLILRNKWTLGSLLVKKAQTNVIRLQASEMGSRSPYMRDQEIGGTKVKKHKVGVPIATSFSSGEGEGNKVRRRMPRVRLQILSLRKRTKGRMGKKEANKVAIKMAAARGKKFVFIDMGKRKGIMKLTGGKRKPKPKMYFDLSNTSVPVRPRPWLAPPSKQVQKIMPRLYRDALLFQIKRHGLFKGGK